ncbi:hypothetical protein Tco_1373676 [Tanacetum coccineum]
MSTPIEFFAFAMNRLKIEKLTKANLVGPVYKVLKGTCRSFIELEYNIDQCYLALTDQLDWANPEGDRCPYDLSKPSTLKGRPGHLTIPVAFFFNNDLEFLRTGNSETKYTTSITKTKAARLSKHDTFSTMRILSVVNVKINKKLGYGYLEEIVVRRADKKLYTFKEGDFKNLHLNHIEDMLILHVQNRLSNLEGNDVVDLVVALRMFTRILVIKKRVEDVQLEFQGRVQQRHAKTEMDIKRSEPVTHHGEFGKDELYKARKDWLVQGKSRLTTDYCGGQYDFIIIDLKLGCLGSLKKLFVEGMPKVVTIAFELFPSLEVLELEDMQSWENCWKNVIALGYTYGKTWKFRPLHG